MNDIPIFLIWSFLAVMLKFHSFFLESENRMDGSVKSSAKKKNTLWEVRVRGWSGVHISLWRPLICQGPTTSVTVSSSSICQQ